LGEVVGRFGSLLLFAYAGRVLGQTGLGAFVLGIAIFGTFLIPAGAGLDRYILRLMAARRSAEDQVFFNAFVLKVVLALPVFTVVFFGLAALGYSHEVQATAWALAPGVLCDSLAQTQQALFSAHERGGPPAAADSIQRLLSAAMGIVALALGGGVVSIGASYSIGSFVGVLIGFVLMRRTVGLPARVLSPRRWSTLAVRSLPYSAQDSISKLLARGDALLLSLLATQAAVGVYGAAYRLLETTTLVPYSVAAAFSAMFTYLESHQKQSLSDAFGRAAKLGCLLLFPFAIAFATLAGPICSLVYGPHFNSAAPVLRALAPTVLLLGLTTIMIALLVARGDPWRVSRPLAVTVGTNVVLNLVLIPSMGALGAAVAMLGSILVAVVWLGVSSSRTVGGRAWLASFRSPVLGAACMALVCLGLRHNLWTALVAGLAVYATVVFTVEWRTNPAEIALLKAAMQARWLQSRAL
jgi:O-antigen/teichoic acid export membrane protein